MFQLIPSDISLFIAVPVLILAALIIGISKSGFAGSTALLAIPLAANVVPIQLTLGFLLPLFIAGDFIAVFQHRKHCSWRHFRWLTFGGLVGILAASLLLDFLLWHMSAFTLTLQLTVAFLCILFVCFQLIRQLGGQLPNIPPQPPFGYIAGFLTGFASTLSNAGSPLAAIYLLEQKLTKALFTGTAVFLFLVINLSKVPSFIYLDFLSSNAVALAAFLLPVVPIGSLIGIQLNRVISEKTFMSIIYVATMAASVSLIIKALSSTL